MSAFLHLTERILIILQGPFDYSQLFDNFSHLPDSNSAVPFCKCILFGNARGAMTPGKARNMSRGHVVIVGSIEDGESIKP